MSADDTLAFLAVAQAGGFTAAASRLHQPKTNLVRRVRSLEAKLGVRLFDRTTRSLALTEAGSIYRQQLGNWAEMLDAAVQAVGELREQPAGWIRISLPHTLAGLITPLLADFREIYPEVRFDLTLDHRLANLIADGVDVALRVGQLPDSTLIARRLTALPNRIYGAPDYLKRHGIPKAPGDLIGHKVLANRLAQRHDGFAWSLREVGRLSPGDMGPLCDYPVNPVMVADDPTALLPALAAGSGLMLVTDATVAGLVRRERVRPVMPDWTGRSPELNALFPPGRALMLKTRLLIDFLTGRLRLADQDASEAEPS